MIGKVFTDRRVAVPSRIDDDQIRPFHVYVAAIDGIGRNRHGGAR